MNLMKAFNKSSLLGQAHWIKKRVVALALTVDHQFCVIAGAMVSWDSEGIISFIKHHIASENTFWVFHPVMLKFIVSWSVIVIIFFVTV
jgi:membrane protein